MRPRKCSSGAEIDVWITSGDAPGQEVTDLDGGKFDGWQRRHR